MTPDPKNQKGWRSLLKRVPGTKTLDASARALGALKRRREIKTGEQLLRLALGYGPGGLSLREASAWAGLIGLANLSDVAVMKRLRGAADWMGYLVGQALVQCSGIGTGNDTKGRRIRVLDGTTLQEPGSTGIDWRLHLTYDVEAQRLVAVELTDRSGAEKLERAAVEPGEIRVADRCYARPDGLRYIVEGGGDYVVRLAASSLRLLDAAGGAFDMIAFLRSCKTRGWGDVSVLIDRARERRGWRPLPARVVVMRKPPAAAARSKREAARVSRKNGHKVQKATLIAAEYLIIITSLDRKLYPPKQVAAIYRLRWQVELAIKRLKSILRIDRLPAKDPGLVRCWLYAHLLVALLIDDLKQDFLDSPPCAPISTATACVELAGGETVAAQPSRRRARTGRITAAHAQRKPRSISSLRSTA
jgi:hypothetical protein